MAMDLYLNRHTPDASVAEVQHRPEQAECAGGVRSGEHQALHRRVGEPWNPLVRNRAQLESITWDRFGLNRGSNGLKDPWLKTL